MSTITAEQLAKVLDDHPELNDNGYGTSGLANPSRDPRKDLANDLEGVQRAAQWISTQTVTARVPPRAASSYLLKHAAEHEQGQYMTNGAFIAACLILGVPVRLTHLNPRVGLKPPRGGWVTM